MYMHHPQISEVTKIIKNGKIGRLIEDYYIKRKDARWVGLGALFYILTVLNRILSPNSGDFNEVINKRKTYNDFIKVYGHLRPSTYDISSPTYSDQAALMRS